MRHASTPSSAATLPSDLIRQLQQEVDCELLLDPFSRGRYSTDASIYQIEPLGVVIPRSEEAALSALAIAAESGIPILPRGAGTSQSGQTVGAALVIDHSKHLADLLALDLEAQTAWVQPGIVLDQLNALLRPHGLWYPVDVSTSAQATLGGMTGNNSCGARSIRYGNMVHNVLAVDAWLSSGEQLIFGPVERVALAQAPPRYRALVETIRALHAREREEIARHVPMVQRRVAGYNLDLMGAEPCNMAQLLVGSEGTLAYFRRIKLKLAPLPAHRTLGVVHFARFYDAMNCTQHIVKLSPTAVELVDRTMIELSRGIATFRTTIDNVVRNEPDALLLVEFAGEDHAAQRAQLDQLVELMGDLGYPDSVVRIEEPKLQRELWEVRKAGLNIMMSMKGDGKPVSFIEDCAVPLEHLADYTDRLTHVFEKHGTQGTWYAHASVGCLHVRPVLDMRSAAGAHKMRAIAEEACALVREFKGSYSGEHGDGLVRSEWIAPIYGERLTKAFGEIKRAFDPKGVMNPGKIVAPSKMDDRSLFRFKPDYRTTPLATALDWSEHEVGPHNRGRGFAAAVEMCNNNGHCRKFDVGTMCPSFRVTRDEQHSTRGRANSLRLALSGQLGPDALTSPAMHEALSLCVSCKGCRRECPTGVDMARMKIEFLHQYHERHARPLKDRLIAHLPRWAPWAARLAPLANLRDRVPGLPWLTEKALGIARERSLPVWHRTPFAGQSEIPAGPDGPEVLLLADTFNRYFEPDILRAAVRVLGAANYRVTVAADPQDARPLCCGRTYLAAGMVDEARHEAERLLAALNPALERGLPVIGLEPACLLGLRDELPALLSGQGAQALARASLLFEEFLAHEARAGRLSLSFNPRPGGTALLHGHCHQKAFDAMGSVRAALALVPGLEVETIQSGCCGMAGVFGFDARHIDVSLRMAEAGLLPAVRAAARETLIVADGTSCRHQILDGAERRALHVAEVLANALPQIRSA